MNKGYIRVSDLRNDINNLDKKMDNIGNDNIINHSTVSEIEASINNIENSIKATKRQNFLKTCIKNIKICGRAIQGIGPYVVVASIVFGLQTVIYDVPFFRQDQFKIAQHEQIIDNSGVFDDKVTYVTPDATPVNAAHFSTGWEKKTDGKYYRTIKEYSIGEKTIDELKEIVNNPNITFDEVFGKSTSTKYEVKTEEEITEKEKQEGKGFKIVYRFTDDEDVILQAQDLGQNIGFSIIYLVFTALCSSLIVLWRMEESDFDFMDHLHRIQRENPTIDLSEVIKLFEEKKIKFERVKHQEVTIEDPITGKKSIIR